MNKISQLLLSTLAGLLLVAAPRHLPATEITIAATTEAPATPPAAEAPAANAATAAEKAHARVKALTDKISGKIHKQSVIKATASTSDADQSDATADNGDDADKDATGDTAESDSHHAHSDNAVVSIGHDSKLAAGEKADAVVSVFGSSTSEGEVADAVVSVLGNTRVTGPVGDTAVAVLGNTYVDSHVKGEVVAVMGDVELGPHAIVDGGVVVVGGTLKRDPAAILRGDVQNVVLFGPGGHLEWLHNWVQHCLVYGRPLALSPGLGWAWGIALAFLGLYLLIALLFPKGIEQCVRTMEEHPGRSVVASILTVLCKPIVFVILVATVIGIALVPFLAMGLFLAGLFGKAVALAWLGRRFLAIGGEGVRRPPVLAVLIGGVVALALYVVPVLGFVAYKGLDILGLGIVVYTLIRSSRSEAGAPTGNAGAATAGAAAPFASTSESVPGAAAAAAAEPAPGGAAAGAAPAAAPKPAAPLADASMERAGFWIRMGGLMLDIILVAVATAFLPFDNEHSHTFLLLLAIYGAVMWKLKGTTVGGAICNLRVVRLDGRAIDWPTATARALGCFLSMAIAGLGFIWVVFDPERQSWHDKIAGTVVVRVPKGTPLV